MRTDDLFAFIRERYLIWDRRERGMPKPWTQDEILQSYRFCNVYRELDTVTQWISANWRDRHPFESDLWFAMVVARLLNWPDTLYDIGFPINSRGQWRADLFCEVIHGRQEARLKTYSGAYIVSTNGYRMDKAIYLAQHVLTPLWGARKDLRPKKGDTLASYHAKLTKYDGLGSFMAAQVVADLKYVEPLLSAEDWLTWAASGPGSRRGLNRVFGLSVENPWKEVDWLYNLCRLHNEVVHLICRAGMPQLHAQDLQNCLCEFDKYERVRLGEGRPRSLYPGKG